MSLTGDRLKERRKFLNISADEVALELGVSRSTIFRYENGYIEKVPANVLEKLADILQTTPAYLMGWEDDPTDWEQVGNEEGIYPPRDYEGDYADYVKYKITQEQDDLIDDYYNTCDSAIKYLKDNGCQVLDGPEESLIIVTPDGEKSSIDSSDLVANFQIFGKSRPGIKKLLRKAKSQGSDENYSPEIRAAARGMMDLSPEDQKTAIDMINFLAKKSKGAKED